MRMYMAYDVQGAEDGALLVFANTAREAKVTVYPEASCLLSVEYIDLRVHWLRDNSPHLLAAADQDKLAKGIPHVIDSPPSCELCCLWGDAPEYVIEENGQCVACNEGTRDEY